MKRTAILACALLLASNTVRAQESDSELMQRKLLEQLKAVPGNRSTEVKIAPTPVATVHFPAGGRMPKEFSNVEVTDSILDQNEPGLDLQIDSIISQADLGFYGKITEAKYYAPSADEMPVTYVTYEILDLIIGKSKDPFVTIVSEGGFSESTKMWSMPSHTPTFFESSVGQERFVFVDSNGAERNPYLANIYVRGGTVRISGKPLGFDKRGGLIDVQAPASVDGNANNGMESEILNPSALKSGERYADTETFRKYLHQRRSKLEGLEDPNIFVSAKVSEFAKIPPGPDLRDFNPSRKK